MPERRGRWIVAAALFSFALAAGTGAYFRFSLVTPLPGVHEYIRHAHSHLMFFSWVTPLLFLLIGWALAERGVRLPGFAALALLAVVGGLLTYAPFLKSGYHLMPVGGKLLPISMLTSGLNGFVWYAFAALYFRATWRVRRNAPLRLFDVSVTLMLASTVAIAALAYLGITGQVERRVMLALVDWFLTLFADGWFGLAVLGLAALTAPRALLMRSPVGLLAWLLAGAMVARGAGRFLADALLVRGAGAAEGAAAAVAGALWIALVAAVHASTQERSLTLLMRQLALMLLLIKGVVELFGATPMASDWFGQPQMHVFFLHAYLLGGVSFMLIHALRAQLGRGAFRSAGSFALAVLALLAGLLPLTPLWPRALAGAWIPRAAAFSSLLPLVAALAALLTLDLGLAGERTPPSRGGGEPGG